MLLCTLHVILNLWLGLGTDENAIIEVLGRRNASQRKKIRETYLQLYKKSLIDELQSELSGDFRVQFLLYHLIPYLFFCFLSFIFLFFIFKITSCYCLVLVNDVCAKGPMYLLSAF